MLYLCTLGCIDFQNNILNKVISFSDDSHQRGSPAAGESYSADDPQQVTHESRVTFIPIWAALAYYAFVAAYSFIFTHSNTFSRWPSQRNQLFLANVFGIPALCYCSPPWVIVPHGMYLFPASSLDSMCGLYLCQILNK